MFTVDPLTATRDRRYPSISLLVPLDGPTPWPARLRALQREATARLRAEFGAGVDRHLLTLLDEAVAAATAPAGARSLGVFVNAAGAQRVGIAVPVRERTVIDDTFATRDLLHHDLRSPRYWVLALSLDDPRLFRGHGPALLPRQLDLGPTAERAPTTRDRRGRDRSDVVDARRARRLRALDAALDGALGRSDDPLLVVGAEPTLGRFLERTRHRTRIEGIVRRAPSRDLAELSRSIEPVVADVLDERRVLALAALERAVDAATATSGIDQVWRQVRRGSGGLLLVEEGFEYPAVLTGEGTLEPASDPAAASVVDDVVDDVIELVLASNGRVELVADGALADHQRIALVPRQRTRA